MKDFFSIWLRLSFAIFLVLLSIFISLLFCAWKFTLTYIYEAKQLEIVTSTCQKRQTSQSQTFKYDI